MRFTLQKYKFSQLDNSLGIIINKQSPYFIEFFTLEYSINTNLKLPYNQMIKEAIMIEGYRCIDKLGKGSFATVYLYEKVQPLHDYYQSPFNKYFFEFKKSDTSYYAFKKYNKPDNNKQGADFSALRQINLMLTCNHPNIVSAYDVIYNKTVKKHELYVVMDFLLQLQFVLSCQKIVDSDEHRKNICYQILKGLAFLHENYIFHRDLKPQNIFSDRDGNIKVADFGFCKEFGTPNKVFTAQVCTKQYRAPQVFFGTSYYNEKSDIWSYGCVIGFIFTNKILFPCTSNDLETLGRIFYVRGTPNQQNWQGFNQFPKFCHFDDTSPKNLKQQFQVSDEVAEILQLTLQLDPKKRPSAKQLLNHKFFKGVEDKILNVKAVYDSKLKEKVSKTKS